jgi:hypothetical protein
MAIKELFYDNRPQVLLDPRASQRIDPRFKFTRNSIGTYVDSNGIVRTAGANQPRISANPYVANQNGLIIEPGRTNHIHFSENLTDSGWTKNNLTVTKETIAGPGGYIPYDKLTLGTFGPPASNTDYTSTASIRRSTGAALTSGTKFAISIYLKAGTCRYVQFIKQALNSAGYSLYFDLQTGTQYSGGGPGNVISGHSIQDAGNGWYRVIMYGTELGPGGSDTLIITPMTVSNPLVAPNGLRLFTGNGEYIYAWGGQYEEGTIESTYIPTFSAADATRAADLLSIEAPLPASGSVYIDARAISANENDTLLSLKNSSNDKIDLAYLSNTATYNSLALIANYDGTSKSSLPLPVPTTDRERNIITYGANNYQYGRDSSRFAPSLSSSVPTGLNKLSIGHDAVDPTKAFNGYINTVYAWSGELTPEVAEALVRGEIDAIDADTYSPTGPVGSLALVINTQGAAADGEKTFTLPAESVATDNDIVITWGDGTESGLDGAAAELGAIGLTHAYPSAGIYPVWVEGKMQNIQYNNISNADDLLLIAEWGTGDMLTAPSTMNGAFYGCSQLDFSSSARTTNRPDTSAVTDWANAFRDCSSITGTFPSFDFTAATTFSSTWNGCSSLASVPAIFVADGSVTQNVTNFSNAWNGCSSLTSFPLIDTSSGINFNGAWAFCSSLTSFPLIDTSSGINFNGAWAFCSSLTSFPLIDTSSSTNFTNAWSGCNSLTSFPLIDTSSSTNFTNAWSGCNSLTSFPLIDTSSGINFNGAWSGCSSLTSFPLIDTSSSTSFSNAWSGCSSLTSFPLIDTSSGTNFIFAWAFCSSLTDFPAGFFDSWAGTPVDECFYRTWDGCSSLTATSVDNILVSIAASGVSAPSGTGTDDKTITIDYDGTTLPGTTATAITTLKSRNWDIYLNGVQQ